MPPTVIPAQPTISAGGRVIAAPFQFVTGDDESLFVRSSCIASAVAIAVQGRRYDADGNIIPFRFVHQPNSDRTVKSDLFPFGRGAVLNLSVIVLNGTLLQGECYLMVQLLKGTVAAGTIVGTLVAGYVASRGALGFPGAPLENSLAGEGIVRSFQGTAPAAGSSLLETVPSGARWQLLSAAVDLTTDATVSNRLGVLVTARAFGVLSASWMTLVFPAGTFGTWAWTAGLHPAGGATIGATPTGTAGLGTPVYMMAGDQLQISAQNLQLGDQFSAPRLTVREWLEF